MPSKCIIVDDEPPAVKILQTYLDSVPSLELVKTCKNAFEAMDTLNSQKIDLMFLDIHMPKLMGTDLLKSLSFRPKAIFTTAYKDFALDAFELDALDYLLKPISFSRFLKAVNKFSHVVQQETTHSDSRLGFMYFRSDRKMVKVFLEDILYIESFKDYVVIHRENEPDLRIKQTLNHVAEMLPEHLFMRIHRSYLVSIQKIQAFTKKDVEIGNLELPIGKSYTNKFRLLVPDDLHLPGGVDER